VRGRARALLLRALLVVGLVPAVAGAQSAPQTPSAPAPRTPTGSRLWLVAGGASTTVRGDCQTCEEESPYRHALSVIAGGGFRANEQMDVGAELLWVPLETASGNIRVTHLDAVAQFRPWVSQGFFIKGGAGMALVRNWVDAAGPSPINQKALSLIIGPGGPSDATGASASRSSGPSTPAPSATCQPRGAASRT